MALEWLALGVSVASLMARVASASTEFDWNTAADAVESSQAVTKSVRRLRKLPPERELAEVLERRLREAHETYLRSHFSPAEADADVQAVISDVAEVVTRVSSAGPGSRIRILILAVERPDDFLTFIRANYGDQVRGQVRKASEPAFDYLLARVTEELCNLLRDSRAAVVESNRELLLRMRSTETKLSAIHDAVTVQETKSIELQSLWEASARAREESRPKYMPAVDRRREFGVSDNDTISTPLVILGEGGAGKSVVAGDLVDWVDNDCILIPCSRVPSNAMLDTAAAIDVALGNAASDSRADARLTTILQDLPEATLIVIDTIDLLLSSDTADNLWHILQRVRDLRPLVVTSREQEWTDLLGRDVLPEHRLGLLDIEQIDAWVEVFLRDQHHLVDKTRDAFRRSARNVARTSEGRVVLGSPVRLAMACSLYAAEGAVPPGLTVPQLYRDYWAENVDQDRRGRRRTPEAVAQQEAAMAIAAKIWEGSTTIFAEYVPTAGISASGVHDLLSSGLLLSNGALLAGFFHQTFAEFAVARHLATYGGDGDIEALRAALMSNSPAHWGVARYLAWTQMDSAQAIRLQQALPHNVEGLRVRLRMLATHDAGTALREELVALELTDEHSLRMAFPALTGADEASAPVVFGSGLRLIKGGSSSQLSAIVRTIGSVLPQLPPAERTAHLGDACEALIRRGDDGLTDLFRLLKAAISDAGASVTDVSALFSLYPEMGSAAQKVLIEATADLPISEATTLFRVAVTSKCPSEAVELLVDLAEAIWKDVASRKLMGWTSWQTMLDAIYPPIWQAVQVRLAGRLSSDEQIRSELLSAVFATEGTIDRRRYTNAASFAASEYPNQVAREILARDVPTSRAVAGNLSTIVSYMKEGLDGDVPLRLWEWFWAMLPLDERRILGAMVSVGSHAVGLLDRTLSMLIDDQGAAKPSLPRPAVESCWDALFSSFSDQEYAQNRDRLANLVASNRIEDRRRRVRMVGREALDSAAAWQSLCEIAFDRGAENFAKLAVNEAVIRSADHSPSSQPLIALVGSPHGYCARVVANSFSDRLPTDWSPTDIEVLLNRLSLAIEKQEDTQVSASILTLLARIARQSQTSTLVNAEIVTIMLTTFREGIETAKSKSHAAAWLDQWLTTMSRIGVYRYSPAEVGDRICKLLKEVDTGSLGSNSARRLATSLIGITGNAVGSARAILNSWRDQPLANQVAVAEALVQGQTPGGRELALQRAREDDCPDELAQRVHALLGT